MLQRGIDQQIVPDAGADFLSRGKNVAAHRPVIRDIMEFVAREVLEVPVIVLGMEHEPADIIRGHRIPVTIRVATVKPLVGIGRAGGGVVHRHDFQRTFPEISDRVREAKEFPACARIVLDPDIRRGKGHQVRIIRRAGGIRAHDTNCETAKTNSHHQS